MYVIYNKLARRIATLWDLLDCHNVVALCISMYVKISSMKCKQNEYLAI